MSLMLLLMKLLMDFTTPLKPSFLVIMLDFMVLLDFCSTTAAKESHSTADGTASPSTSSLVPTKNSLNICPLATFSSQDLNVKTVADTKFLIMEHVSPSALLDLPRLLRTPALTAVLDASGMEQFALQAAVKDNT